MVHWKELTVGQRGWNSRIVYLCQVHENWQTNFAALKRFFSNVEFVSVFFPMFFELIPRLQPR